RARQVDRVRAQGLACRIVRVEAPELDLDGPRRRLREGFLEKHEDGLEAAIHVRGLVRRVDAEAEREGLLAGGQGGGGEENGGEENQGCRPEREGTEVHCDRTSLERSG